MKNSILILILIFLFSKTLYSQADSNARIPSNDVEKIAKYHNEIMREIIQETRENKINLSDYILKRISVKEGKTITINQTAIDSVVNNYAYLPYNEALNKLLVNRKINRNQFTELKKVAALFSNASIMGDAKKVTLSIEQLENNLKRNRTLSASEKEPITLFYRIIKSSDSLYNEYSTTSSNAKGSCSDDCCKCIKKYKTGLIIADGLGAVVAVLSCLAVPEPVSCIYRIIYSTTFASAGYLYRKCGRECF